jgi:hypothetical protein
LVSTPPYALGMKIWSENSTIIWVRLFSFSLMKQYTELMPIFRFFIIR